MPAPRVMTPVTASMLPVPTVLFTPVTMPAPVLSMTTLRPTMAVNVVSVPLVSVGSVRLLKLMLPWLL